MEVNMLHRTMTIYSQILLTVSSFAMGAMYMMEPDWGDPMALIVGLLILVSFLAGVRFNIEGRK